MEAVRASCWRHVSWVVLMRHELVAGLVGTEGILWPGLVAGTVCGRLSRREVGLVVRRGGRLEAAIVS